MYKSKGNGGQGEGLQCNLTTTGTCSVEHSGPSCSKDGLLPAIHHPLGCDSFGGYSYPDLEQLGPE